MSCEVSWFAALCDDDYEYLGVPDRALLSSWEHCRGIALAAEEAGYDNLLLPSGYAMGIDSVAFAAGIAPLLRRMRLLVAVRMGEMWPPQLARQLASIDQMLGGRLTINIISSALPGQTLDSSPLPCRWAEGRAAGVNMPYRQRARRTGHRRSAMPRAQRGHRPAS
jgi:alkanesulfonate monooxygenase